MSEPRVSGAERLLPDIREVPVDQIEISDRLRDVDFVEAAKIGASMRDVGQITPIMVAPLGDERWGLVAGAHRVEGAKLQRIPHLRAIIIEASVDELRLKEIDENLYRHELNAYDIATFIAERRRLWEKLFGPVKRGRDGRSKGTDCPLSDEIKQAGFVRATAEQFKLHPKAVKRALQRRAHIAEPVWAALRGSAAACNATFLDSVARTEIDLQMEMLERVQSRGATFEAAFADLRRQRRGDGDPTPNLTAVKRAWSKADEAERAHIHAFITAQSKIKGGK